MDTETLAFPEGFLWGTATSAHQVEGGNHNNDWWDWEQTAGHITDGSTSEQACDHYHRFREDWQLARDLGQNAHRLSMEWSRIEPQEGVFDNEALAHYRQVLEAMREYGLEPVVTLHHFTNPRWFAAMGAWQNPSAVRLFGRYAARVVSEYKDLCRLWITINEPVIAIYEGYLLHRWPPGKGNFVSGMATLRAMLRAHGRAYRRIHDFQADAQVGIAHNMRIFDPANPRSPFDRLVAGIEDRVFNRVLLWTLMDGFIRFPIGWGQYAREVDDSLDFIGLNYYARDMVAFTLRSPSFLIARNFARAGAPTDAFGWEIYPEGLYRWLTDLAQLGKPLYVTENGLADKTDAQRPAYIVRSVAAMWRAIQEGAPVRGYFHWTLMDNFEWAEGYGIPFGLVSVNRETQERRLKPSALVYRDICQANGVPAHLLAMIEDRIAERECPSRV